MFFSRLWMALLALAAAAAVALALIVGQPVGGDLGQERSARLIAAAQATQLLLRDNARSWIEATHQATQDRLLGEALAQASAANAGDITMLHATVGERLKQLSAALRSDMAIAVDVNGRVLARVGLDESIYKDQIEGLPPVDDALRGQRGDDTWSIGGRLYRVAAAPVIVKQAYVGALVIGQELGPALAQTLKQTVDSDVAFLLRGKVLASTLPESGALAAHLAQLQTAIEQAAPGQKPAVVRLGPDASGLLATALRLPGQAAAHQAAVALVMPRPAVAQPFKMSRERLINGLHSFSPTVWLLLVGCLVMALLIGWLFLAVESARRIHKAVGRSDDDVA